MSAAHAAHAAHATPETNIVDTLQSLTVAFALAMTVRSFVTEGFVIPTGSMAPTLLGAHIRWQSPATGYRFPIDASPLVDYAAQVAADSRRDVPRPLFDPMLSVTQPIMQESNARLAQQARMGDRVLVMKYLYSFFAPHRWDVVVFKNPTDPVGETQNYIKRLVGLPSEQLLTIDGDIWTAPLDAPLSGFRVQRKPDYVQRSIWQPVHDSDYAPVDRQKVDQALRRTYESPWEGEKWSTEGRTYATDTPEQTELRWDPHVLPINDWCPYNMYRGVPMTYPVSDVRIAAAIEADDPSAFATEFELTARGHVFTWQITGGKVKLSMRHMESETPSAEQVADLVWPPRGQPCDVEFWHVDQAMSVWLNGRKVAELLYDDWTPEDRIRHSLFGRTVEQYKAEPVSVQGPPPQLLWRFEGSPVKLHRVRVDRDLYYRPGELNPVDQAATNGPALSGLAFGTDLDHPARLEADEFLMMGDNSSASRDGRLWGRPHQLVAKQLGHEHPFVVPGELLLGKAWCVYFPAPLPLSPTGRPFVPDFGHLRFIR